MSGEFYKNDYGSRRGEKPHRSLLMWLLDLVMTLLTVVVGATMAVTYFVPYVNPAGVWFFPLLGLAAPAIYVATVILALYWVIRWRLLRAGTILALVVIGLFKVSLFYKPEFRRSYGEESYDRRAFKVMTYNVRSFFGESGASNVDDIVRLIGEYDPDIVCMQEFNARLAEKSDDFALLDEKYESAALGPPPGPAWRVGGGGLLRGQKPLRRRGPGRAPPKQRAGNRGENQPPEEYKKEEYRKKLDQKN